MSKAVPYLIKIFSKLPLPILHGLSWLVYILLFHVLKVRRKLTINNLKGTYTEFSDTEILQLAKSHYKSACIVFAETIKAFNFSKQQMKERVTFKNIDVLKKYLDQNQSVIIATAHYCNMEWALLSSAQHIDYPVDTIYRSQRTPMLEKLFFELRTKFDITPLPMETCIADSLKRAKITRIIALAADQSPKKTDIPYWQTFLNRDTAFHTGTEKIAKAFKYPIIFMSMKRTKRGYYEATLKLLTEPPYPKEPNYIMEKYVVELETLVNSSPKDWLWAYRRWKLEKPAFN